MHSRKSIFYTEYNITNPQNSGSARPEAVAPECPTPEGSEQYHPVRDHEADEEHEEDRGMSRHGIIVCGQAISFGRVQSVTEMNGRQLAGTETCHEDERQQQGDEPLTYNEPQ